MRKMILLALIIALLSVGAAFSQTQLEPGSPCLAYWEPTKLYYVGTVVAVDDTVKGGAYFVVFADGDQAKVSASRTRTLDLKKGSQVLAMWSDKKFYPGRVAEILGNALYIEFDDGDEGWTSWAGIAIQPE